MYCYKGTDGRRDRPPSLPLIIIVVLIVLILLGPPPPIRPSSVHSIKADRHFCMTMGGRREGRPEE